MQDKKKSAGRPHRQTARRRDAVEQCSGFGERVAVEGVVVPAAFPAAGNNAGVAEGLEVPRQTRLLEVEVVHQVAHASLTVEQQRHNLDADGIGQRVKKLGGALGVDGGCSRHAIRINKFS